MKQKALTIEQMKHLEGLGADISKASLHWQFLPNIEEMRCGKEIGDKDLAEPHLFVSGLLKHEYPAFTLQDILELLPKEIKFNGIKYCFSIYFTKELWVIRYEDACGFSYKAICSDDILEVAYEMLVWCLENGYAHLIIK